MVARKNASNSQRKTEGVLPNEKVSKLSLEQKEAVLFSFMDNRIFGAMIPNKDDVFSGIQTVYTGPLQVLPSITQHPIAIEMTQVTSPFKGRKEITQKKENADETDLGDEREIKSKLSGGFGFRYTVPYGLYIGGAVFNAMRGKICKTTDHDIKMFDSGAIYGPLFGRSATKTWVQHIVFIHVEYQDDSDGGWHDLMGRIQTTVRKDPESITDAPYEPTDVTVNTGKLQEYLANNDNGIHRVEFYIPDYALNLFPDLRKLKNVLESLPKMDNYTDSHTRNHEYVWITEVRHSSANGDPAMDNQPRSLLNNHGIYTPERFKRWVREYIEAMGERVFVSRNELSISPKKASQHLIQKMNKAYPVEKAGDE